MSGNKNAIDLIQDKIKQENNLTERQYNNLRNQYKIDWSSLSINQNAIDILKENIDKIDWHMLSENVNAIDILHDNLDKVNWYELSRNKSAIDILRNNQDKIDWYSLSANPSIFIDESMPEI